MMRKDRQIFDREGKPLTMKSSFVPATQNWVHFASRSSKQAVGQVPDLPSAAGAYPAKLGSLATLEKHAKGTQDKIGFVPHFPCIFMKLNAISAGKGPLDQTSNPQPLARNGYRPPPTWSHQPMKSLGHNRDILSRCSPDGRPRYRLTHHVDS